MKNNQFGRSLVETLSVLVLMALLVTAGLIGYNAVVRKYREHETVKQISELSVKYKLNPVKAQGKFVQMKEVYPEAERADAMTIRTADTAEGRVSLQVFDEVASSSSFAVVVNSVLDDSCRSILKNVEYDMVVAGNDLEVKTATKENAYSRDYLLNDPEGQEIAQKLCEAVTANHNIGTMGLVIGDHCPNVGASYWYNGRCWNCASDRAQDIYGNCCAKGQIDACGVCPGKCPNGGACNTSTGLCVECTSDDNCTGRADGKLKCDLSSNKCVECVNVGQLCSGTGPGTGAVDKYCMKNHTCQECDTTKHMRWNKSLDICECVTPLLALGETCYGGCCVEGTTCHEGVCTGCWADYDPADPTKEGSCSSERPLCQDGKCHGCPVPPAVSGATCSALCGCDASKGLSCVSGACACPADKPYWNGSNCVECISSDTCAPTEFCNTSGGQYVCEACTGVTDGDSQYLKHVPHTTDRCECTEGFRIWCGSTKTSISCLFGKKATTTCQAGCKQHPDCDENYYCSCLGTGCPAKGGECMACPSDKPLRPKDSSEDCKPGLVCDCDLNDPTCPSSCCKGCDYKNDPEHCPVEKCCNPAEDPDTCPDNPPCDPSDKCCKDPASCCGECEEYVPYKGCVSKCAADEACVSYNKGTNTCGESQCIKVISKDKLVRKKGTLNDRIFYFPPSDSKYRMTHASADRFCAHYGMHLARVMEACMKDFKYDSGHDCPNFAAYGGEGVFTDRGETYNLANWNTSSSGDFWLAERDGDMALRVTHSCGNNHETNVCADIYPLCTE